MQGLLLTNCVHAGRPGALGLGLDAEEPVLLRAQGLKGASEDDMEAVLDRVMMLFRYLQEKDVFEKYYKQHLAKRLLSGRTARPPPSQGFRLPASCTALPTSRQPLMRILKYHV